MKTWIKESTMRTLIFIIPVLSLSFLLCSDLKQPLSNNEDGCQARDCHPSTVLSRPIPDSGKHTQHLNSNIKCDSCHYNYMDNPKHRDGNLDINIQSIIVSFDLLYLRNEWKNNSKSCSNIDCHGGSPAVLSWYDVSSSGCSICHSSGSAIYPVTYSHPKHLEAGYDCVECHYNYKSERTHMNGTVNSATDNALMIKFRASFNPHGTYNPIAKTCSSLSCHGNSLAASSQGTNVVPQWDVSATGACGTCHKKDTLAQGSHAAHLSAYSGDCGRCHKDNTSESDHHTSSGMPVNGTVNISFYNNTGSFSSPTCSGVTCHGSGTPSWGGSLTCGSCHTYPPTSNGHAKHVGSLNFACGRCHTGNHHADGQVDIDFDTVNPLGNYAPGISPGTGTCSSLKCHGADTPNWDDSAGSWPLASCITDCHNSPLVNRRQITGAGGDFNRPFTHAKTVTLSDCLLCHDNSNHMGGAIRLRNVDTGTVYTYSGSKESLSPFCISCHDSGAGKGINGDDRPFADNILVPALTAAMTSSLHYTTTKISCFNCHLSGSDQNAHGSSSSNRKQVSSRIDGSNITYNSNPGDAKNLCFACHDSNGPATSDILTKMSGTAEYKPLYSGTPFYYKTFNSKHDLTGNFDCTSCHSPHYITASQKVIDPDSPSSGFTFENNEDVFCLRCHDNAAPGGINMGVYNLTNIAANWNTSLHGGGTLRGNLGGSPKLGYSMVITVNSGSPLSVQQTNWNKTAQTLTVSSTNGWPDSGSLRFHIRPTFYEVDTGCNPGYWNEYIYDVSYTGRTGTQFTGVTGSLAECNYPPCNLLPADLLLVGYESGTPPNDCNIWFKEIREPGGGHDIAGSPAPKISCATCHNPHGSNNQFGGNPYHFNDVITDDYSGYDNGSEWNGSWHPNQFSETNWAYTPPNIGNLDPNVVINSDYMNSWYKDMYYTGFNQSYKDSINNLSNKQFGNNLSQLCNACHSTAGKVKNSTEHHYRDTNSFPCGADCHAYAGNSYCNGDTVCDDDPYSFDEYGGNDKQTYRRSSGNGFKCVSCHSHGKAPKNRGGIMIPLF